MVEFPTVARGARELWWRVTQQLPGRELLTPCAFDRPARLPGAGPRAFASQCTYVRVAFAACVC